MTEYVLTVNGVEIPVRKIDITMKRRGFDPLEPDVIELHAKDCVVATEDVGELLASLMVDS